MEAGTTANLPSSLTGCKRNDAAKSTFWACCSVCKHLSEYIPVYCVLSFFVGAIVKCWWDQFLDITWPDNLAMSLGAYTRDRSECMECFLLRYPRELLLCLQSAPFQCLACYVESCLRMQDIVSQVRAGGSIDFNRSVELFSKRVINFLSGLGAVRSHNLISVPPSRLGLFTSYSCAKLLFLQAAVLPAHSHAISPPSTWQFMDPNKWRWGWSGLVCVDFWSSAFPFLHRVYPCLFNSPTFLALRGFVDCDHLGALRAISWLHKRILF
ncbi:unnamed protein product [Taenia asiatica]|uniref:Bestrophin homolog n=1 Tax=Taenia asiatica TaxID=60517 RepID=A0A0R3WEP4_TAEAS|nr:unnamed protein product [Taenia asiatica]